MKKFPAFPKNLFSLYKPVPVAVGALKSSDLKLEPDSTQLDGKMSTLQARLVWSYYRAAEFQLSFLKPQDSALEQKKETFSKSLKTYLKKSRI